MNVTKESGRDIEALLYLLNCLKTSRAERTPISYADNVKFVVIGWVGREPEQSFKISPKQEWMAWPIGKTDDSPNPIGLVAKTRIMARNLIYKNQSVAGYPRALNADWSNCETPMSNLVKADGEHRASERWKQMYSPMCDIVRMVLNNIYELMSKRISAIRSTSLIRNADTVEISKVKLGFGNAKKHSGMSMPDLSKSYFGIITGSRLTYTRREGCII